MIVHTEYIEFSTNGDAEIIDITPDLMRRLDASGLTDGTVTVFVPGATGGLPTIELAPGLVRDLAELWEKLIPATKSYHHDRTWGDGNGHSHLRAALLGPSLTVPFTGGQLTLGTWQQVIFIDFDNRSRHRRLVCQFMGQ